MAIFEMGAFLVVLISWWDDIKPLPVWVRLIVHFLAATLAIWAFGFWKIVEIPFIGEVFLGWFGLPLSLLWIIGLTNIFNFMDGIDGIAAGHGILAGLGWGILGWLSEVPQVTVLGLLVSVCCLGFLLHNWAPARVFLGDVGSSFLGFIFGSLPLYMRTLSGGKPALSHSLMLGVFMVWPFLFDTTLTLIRRLIKRENIFQAHHSHLYQRLVVIGFRHSTVSLIYGFLALVCILIGVGWYLENFFFVKYFPLFLLLIGAGLWSFVVIQERIYYKKKRLNGGKIQN
jgi:UDP-N-acetylmuramyl pentapeptide phosphotransferase/UDP-N-acetylglucosamine-1-phosphate transferase